MNKIIILSPLVRPKLIKAVVWTSNLAEYVRVLLCSFVVQKKRAQNDYWVPFYMMILHFIILSFVLSFSIPSKLIFIRNLDELCPMNNDSLPWPLPEPVLLFLNELCTVYWFNKDALERCRETHTHSMMMMMISKLMQTHSSVMQNASLCEHIQTNSLNLE